MHVTLVLIGVEVPYPGLVAGTGTFTGNADGTDPAATQTQRRFDVVELDPFRYDTPTDIAAWVAHLAGLEDQLRLLRGQPGMLTGGAMPEYLFGRTAGVIGLLERLIEDGCSHAMDTSAECLTTDLLDEVDITLAAAGRVPAAGEVPPIPAHGRPPRRSGRNTVFDDHGHAGARTAHR